MDPRTQFIHDMMGQTVRVIVDRPVGCCHKGIHYPINYGFIPGMMAGDGEEQDAYILGITEPIDTFEGQVIGGIRRKNDCEDKLVVVPEGMVFHQGQIAEAVRFQEQYFDSYVVCQFRKSCGVLPYRITDTNEEYLIVFEQFSQCWSLPKGHMEPGETEAETALRELWEETGLTALLDTSRSAVIEYPVSPVSRKQVVFFKGLVSGEPRTRAGEIQGFRWVTAAQLGDYLFPDTVNACKKLI